VVLHPRVGGGLLHGEDPSDRARRPGSALVRAAGLGWPILALAKLGRDIGQVWQHRRRVGARFLPTLPLLAAFETTLFFGGLGALLKLPPPRVS
jgi:hypothetical protein